MMKKNLSQKCLLNPALHTASIFLVVIDHQGSRHDGCRYVLAGVDDLLDPRHTKGDVHSGDTGEMESL